MRLHYPTLKQQFKNWMKERRNPLHRTNKEREDLLFHTHELNLAAHRSRIIERKVPQRKHFLRALSRAYDHYTEKERMLELAILKKGCPDIMLEKHVDHRNRFRELWSILLPRRQGDPAPTPTLASFLVHAAARANEFPTDAYRGPFYSQGSAGPAGMVYIRIESNGDTRVQLNWWDPHALKGYKLYHDIDPSHANQNVKSHALWAARIPPELVARAKRLESLRERIQKQADEYRAAFGPKKRKKS